MPIVTKERVRDFAITGLGLGLIATAALAVDSQVAETKPSVEKHKVVYPQFDPTIASGCTAEIAAYASALVALQNAEKVADECYMAWMDCDMEQMTPDSMPEPISEAYSVLVQD